MSIPSKCKYCSHLDYIEEDDGDKRMYKYICTYGEECIEEERNE